MDPMRWTILGVGAALLAAIYVFGRWRQRRRGQASEPSAKPGQTAGAAAPREQSERPFIDDDDLRGIDDLLREREVDPDPDLGLDLSSDTPEPGRPRAPEAETGPEGPWWQHGPASLEGAPEASSGSASMPAGAEPAGDTDAAASDERAAGPEEEPPGHRQSGEAVGPSGAEHRSSTPEPEPEPEPGPRGAGATAGRSGSQASADEPPALKLPPASQVEISAFRSGDVPEAEKLMVVFVSAGEGARFLGPAIGDALRAVRLVPGEHRIWHRRGQSEAGRFTLFSCASMVEPGYLDPEESLPRLETPGLVFFMQLPLPVDSEEALDAMLATAYQVSVQLGGHLLDSTRSTLTRQVAEHMREQLREHRRQLHLAVHKRPST